MHAAIPKATKKKFPGEERTNYNLAGPRSKLRLVVPICSALYIEVEAMKSHV